VGPSFKAFADELEFLKRAEADEPQQVPDSASAAPVQDEEQPKRLFQDDAKAIAKQRLKNSILFGVGHGLGTGVGMLAGEKLLPKVLPQRWSDPMKRNVGFTVGGLGAIGALALWDAMRQAAKAEQDVLERHRQRV